ncbi:HEAT repeat domain-containing protein [Planctomycetota bacterium]
MCEDKGFGVNFKRLIKTPEYSDEEIIARMKVRMGIDKHAALTNGIYPGGQFVSKKLLVMLATAALLLAGIMLALHLSRRQAIPPKKQAVVRQKDKGQVKLLQPVLRHVYTNLHEQSNLAVVEDADSYNLYLMSDAERLSVWEVCKLTDTEMEVKNVESGETISLALSPFNNGIVNFSDDIPEIYSQWQQKTLRVSDWESLTQLINQGDAAALGLLNSMIAQASNKEIRDQARTALYGDTDSNALGQLIAMVADRKHACRGMAIRSLAKIQSPVACLALRKIAADAADPERAHAIRGLAALKDQNALNLLESISKDGQEEQSIRRESKKAVAKIQRK